MSSAARARTRPRGSRRLSVGLFAPYRNYGGTEEYLNTLVRPLAEIGCRLVFFHPWTEPHPWVDSVSCFAESVCYAADPSASGWDGPSDSASSVKADPTSLLRQLHRRVMPRSLRFLAGFLREVVRLRSLFRKRRMDVLMAPDLGLHPFIVAARLAGVPRVAGALGCLPSTDPERSTSLFRALEAVCLACTDEIAAVSQSGRDAWLRRTRLNPRKVKVIYNGIDAADENAGADVSAEVRAELGIPAGARVVGVSAYLNEGKGHRFLLEAFPRVLESVPEAWLLLAGDGPCRSDLEEHAHRLGIGERTRFLGYRSDIDRIVQAYDVVALTSLFESMPFSLLEGMAAGKPVVASSVGGIPELVQDSVTGFLVPPGRPEILAEALIKALQHPETTRRMGVAAREHVRANFSVARMVHETTKMILGVTDE